MARRRFFADWIREGAAEVGGENAHHLARVLRVQVGQTFELTDGEQAWLGSVESVRKDFIRFALIEPIDAGPPLLPAVLYLALIKFDRFEWAIEKATELSVTRIVPVETARTDQGLFAASRKRVERWRKIVREASEQSRRLQAPPVDDPVRFQTLMSSGVASEIRQRVWLDERPGAPALLSSLEPHSAVALIVGPEGGWTDAERVGMTDSGWKAASLGRPILRAETAVCAALAIVSAYRSSQGVAPSINMD